MDSYNGQVEQDKFILNILKQKRNGYFLEIGSNHPITINNTYILEHKYDWKGIIIDHDEKYLPLYKQYRQNSIHIIDDARKIDYKFIINKFPLNFDYLQIDLEVSNGCTIETLQKLDNEIFDNYKFAVITFEHDIYYTNFENTKEKSKEIFAKRGYYCVFENISNDDNPFEDLYVHPELVDMEYVNNLQKQNSYNKFINGKDIKY